MSLIKKLVILSVILAVASCEKTDPMEPISDPTETEGSFSSENTELLNSEINDVLNGNLIPGIVVGVKSLEHGTYLKAFGFSDVAQQTPMKIDAIFGIGSVHKNFKWILLHLLAEEGTINLDDLVNAHVDKPSLPGVTLRHLLQHSSGLCDIPDAQSFAEYVFENPTTEFSYDEMIDFLSSASGTNSYGSFENGKLQDFTIGESSSYSSFGPLIAAEVVKNVTGKNIRDLIDEKILVPLKLVSTSHMAYEADPLLLTPGYADFTTKSPFTPSASSTMGLSSANGGAMHSNVSDLLEFVHHQFTDKDFLSNETINDLTSSYLQAPGMNIGQGVIQFDQWKRSNLWGHAGFGIRSHSTTILHNIEKEISIVVLTNIYTPRDDFQTNITISDAIMRALF